MVFPVSDVLCGESGVADDEKVFGVIFLGGFGEVEGAGQNDCGIDDHDFVVSDGVFGVDEGGHAGMEEEIGGGIFFGALAFVEDDRVANVTTMGVNHGLSDWSRGEAVGLDEN